MLRFARWKIILVSCICLLGVYVALPNVLPQNLKEHVPLLSTKTMNLGLDLQGGSHVLLEIDMDNYLREQLEQIRADIRSNLRAQMVDGTPISFTGLTSNAARIELQVTDPRFADAAAKFIRGLSDAIEVETDGVMVHAYFSEKGLKHMKQNVMEQSLEIVRRRVDETGTREPDIVRQGEQRILVQVPGLEHPERLKQLLGKTAKLSFHLLDDALTYSRMATAPTSINAIRLPGEADSADGKPTFYAVKRQAIISGESLVDARASFTENQAGVSFRFNDMGAKKFAEVTRNNVGKPFAIVLDNKVISAPVIREPILGGSGMISGHFTTESANDLAVLLRAGALPAPLLVVEERNIGPSLGRDSIIAGRNAAALGVVLVMAFMVVGYGIFGVFANIALLMNIVLTVAAMSLLEATLTLPGIAGMVLTMGMAVDANVLIYERMREEYALGKTVLAAIENGFRRAFSTIFDSNITTLIAATMLFMFGSGTIKGFAVTLTIGIMASMFTAVLLTRLMVSLWVKQKRPMVLPI